jgi:drug/metabolite transporter (DMT)-like permease
MLTWLWIPITLAAAAAQTVRNASQKSLVKSAGTLPATFVRFAYGLPFAFVALVVAGYVISGSSTPMPSLDAKVLGWIVAGGGAQLAATALLIMAMETRSFVVAVAYAKTEILQVGVFSIVLLAEPLSGASIAAIALATVGVLLLSIKPGDQRGTGVSTWFSASALLGLASGACFGLSAVGFRGAVLAIGHPLPWVSALFALTWSMFLQTLLLGAWLFIRDRRGLMQVVFEWRVSTLAGFMGALASFCWFTAFALRSAVDVRIVGLVELVYSYGVSRRFFREHVSWREIAGMTLVVGSIVLTSLA